MDRKNDYRFINNDVKLVAVPASDLHQIYIVKGGLQEYNDWVGEEYIKAFIRQNSEEVNDELEAEARRSQLKLVG